LFPLANAFDFSKENEKLLRLKNYFKLFGSKVLANLISSFS
jgi:hypothetical protein